MTRPTKNFRSGQIFSDGQEVWHEGCLKRARWGAVIPSSFPPLSDIVWASSCAFIGYFFLCRCIRRRALFRNQGMLPNVESVRRNRGSSIRSRQGPYTRWRCVDERAWRGRFFIPAAVDFCRFDLSRWCGVCCVIFDDAEPFEFWQSTWGMVSRVV